MALPGVRTVLKDRFFSLSRSNIPETVRVVVIGRRNNSEVVPEGDPGVERNFVPYLALGEEAVIANFGAGSELHRGYLETVSGGAARVFLVSWGSTDSNADDYAPDSALSGSGTEDPFTLAFDAAEAIQGDILVPYGRGGFLGEDEATPSEYELGFQADHEGLTNLVARVAARCKEITDRSNPCFAVMGVTPMEGGDVRPTNEINDHFDFPNLPDRESIEDSYVVVVATELRPVGYPTELGWTNGAATYAGFLSTLEAEMASTGKRLYNIRQLRYAPTRVQQEEMVAKGLTPVKQNFSREAVVVDGLTFGKATSDFTRLSTLRIVFAAIELVRQTAENYVGYPATLHHRNAMDTAIGSQLRGMLITGALLDADYDMDWISGARESTVRINLVLTPAFEMRNIDVSISIRL